MGFLGSMLGSSSGAGYQGQLATLPTQTGLVDQINGQNAQAGNVENMLSQEANGGGALAQMQTQAAQQNAGQAASMVESQKGLNPALAARLAGQQQVQATQGAAAQTAQNQLGAQNALGSFVSGQQNTLQNALAAQNNSQVANYSQFNNANSGVAQQNAKGQAGLINGAGQAAAAFVARGGEVDRAPVKNFYANHLTGKPQMMKSGGQVPGKDVVNHNSYANDKVQAVLSPKEIVLPLSVTQSKDPAGNAAKFVAAVLAKKGLKRGLSK